MTSRLSVGPRVMEHRTKRWVQEVTFRGEKLLLWSHSWADLDQQIARLRVKK